MAASLDLRKNGSLLFQRTDHSWHGVQPLKSPREDVYRKLFIITINIPTLQVWWRCVRGKDPDGYPFKAELMSERQSGSRANSPNGAGAALSDGTAASGTVTAAPIGR